jgi:hypothetical protein
MGQGGNICGVLGARGVMATADTASLLIIELTSATSTTRGSVGTVTVGGGCGGIVGRGDRPFQRSAIINFVVVAVMNWAF